MPNKSVKITTPDGKSVVLNSPDEFDAYLPILERNGIDMTKVQVEEFIKPRDTDIYDRIAGGAAGAALGSPAGVPGMIAGGAMGALFPPRSVGDMATMAFGGATAKPLGKLTQGLTANAGPLRDFLTRAGLGVADAEAGEVIKSTVDTGKPQGFNPLSLEGAVAGLLPNVESQVMKKLMGSPGGLTQRMKNNMPGMFNNQALISQLQNTGQSEAANVQRGKQLVDSVFSLPQKGRDVVSEQANVSLKPFRDVVSAYDANANDIIQKINALKQTPHTGFFSAADNLAERVRLESELERITDTSAKIDNELTLMRLNKMKNQFILGQATGDIRQANKNAKADIQGQIADYSTEQAKGVLTDKKQQLVLIEQMMSVLNDPSPFMTPAMKRREIENLKLQSKFSQTFWQGVDNGKDEVDKRELRRGLVDLQKQISADKKALRQKTAAKSNINQTNQAIEKAKSEQTVLSNESDTVKAQLGIPDIKNSINVFRKELEDKTILPREVRNIVDAPDMDAFVKSVRGMNTQELNTAVSFLPPAKQKEFKESVGDALVYDFFVRAYDPSTGLFTRINEAAKLGLPNVEFFTGNAQAQKTFVDLTNAMMKYSTPDASGRFGTYLKNAFTAATIRGFAYSSMYALFHAGKASSNMGISAAAGLTGGILGVAIPSLMSRAMQNPKLAKDVISFIEGGGTVALQTLPYLSAYLKKEGKPVSEDELTSNKKLFDEIVNQGGGGNPIQPNPGSPQGVNSPVPAQQQSPISPENPQP